MVVWYFYKKKKYRYGYVINIRYFHLYFYLCGLYTQVINKKSVREHFIV